MDIQRSSKDFAAIGYFLMKGGAGIQDALEHAERWNLRAAQILKAAINAGTLSSPGWAGNAASAAEAQSAFLASLRGVSIFDSMLPDMVRVPNGPATIRINTQAIVGTTTAEAKARPITRLQFVTADDWPLFNSQAIVILSDSVLDMFEQEAIDLVERELRAGVIAADRRLLPEPVELGRDADRVVRVDGREPACRSDRGARCGNRAWHRRCLLREAAVPHGDGDNGVR